MPLKIAIDGRCLTDHYPGIGRYLFNLLRALAGVAEDAEISVFTAADGANTRFDLEALAALDVRLVPVSSPIRGAGQQLQDRRDEERPDRQRHAEVAHAGGAQLHDRRDVVDRAHDRRPADQDDADRPERLATAGVEVFGATMRRASMEDVYFALEDSFAAEGVS